MRFTLWDLDDMTRNLSVDVREWRGILEILYRDGALEQSSALRLIWRLGGEGTAISQEETRGIAHHIEAAILPGLPPGQARVRLRWSAPDRRGGLLR